MFSLVTEKENLEKIDDDEDSQGYHLEGTPSGDDHDYVSGEEYAVDESAVNESADSNNYEGELT